MQSSLTPVTFLKNLMVAWLSTGVKSVLKIASFCWDSCKEESWMYKVTYCFWRSVLHITVFTALHVMQTRYSEENSVRPSVRPSVCHTRVLWQNGRKICADLYTIRKNIYPSFLTRRMVGGGRPLLREILGQPTPVGAKSPTFNRYSPVAPQP